MKIKIMFAMCLGALGGVAGNICTWTGAAGDGRLGTAGNWDVKPVPGNGDTLNLDAAADTLTNDFEVLNVARMTFRGNAEVRLVGGKIVFNGSGTEVWNNSTKVVFDVPVQVSGEGVSQFYIYGSIDFLQPVVIDNKSELECRGPSGDIKSTTIKVHFYESITGGGTSSKLSFGYGRGSHTYFHKVVDVNTVRSTNLYNMDYVHFMAPNNKVVNCEPCYTFFVADCADAWGEDNCLKAGTYYTSEAGTTVYDFQTYDQTIDALDGCNTHVQVKSSGAVLTLKVKGRWDRGYNGAINGATTVVIDSVDKRGQNFYKMDHGMTGAIIVKSGAFGAYGTSTFANVPTAVVHANGILRTGSSATSKPVFGGLRNVRIEDGGQFIVEAGCTYPLTDDQTTFRVSPSAVVSAAGKTLRLRSVFVDGVALPAGTYKADNASWIADDGTIVITAETPQQWIAGDGDWNTAENWMNGVPTGNEDVLITRPRADYAVTVSDARTQNGRLEIANASGTATLRVEAAGSLKYDGAGMARPMNDVAVLIGEGGRLDSGGDLTVSNLTGRFEIRDGGVLAVTNAAFVLKTLGTDSSPTNHALYVMPGGLLSFGGTATCHVATDPVSESRHLVNDGGEIRFGGEAIYYGGDGWTTLFGSGRTVFEDSAQLERGPGGVSPVRYYFSPTRQGPENMALYEFRDSSKLTLGKHDGVYVNFDSPELDNYVTVVFDSSESFSVGELWCGMRGHTEFEQKRGILYVQGGNGMFVGSRASAYRGTLGDAACTSVVRVAENATLCLASGWNGNRGLHLGDGRVDQIVPRHVLGVVETAGSVTNWHGDVMIGMGAAEGRYVMTDGNFYSYVTDQGKPIAVGYANGLGYFIVSNGVFEAQKQPIYVGGVPADELREQPGGGGMPEMAYTLRHDAEGFMTVAASDVSKPCMVTADSLYVGKDGTGIVELGSGGRIMAGMVKLTNGAKSCVKFVVDAMGSGVLECDALEISPGAKLEVDAMHISGTASRTLMMWNSVEGAFGPNDIVCKAPVGWRLSVGAKRILLTRKGAVVVIR